jgi:bisphosphoglycerate-dependent phosphoglycerate mutase
MKKNDLVTAKAWYLPRRVYGKVIGRYKDRVYVQGKFGLEQFHKSTVKVVKKRS